jgi:ankyrin repeat protein
LRNLVVNIFTTIFFSGLILYYSIFTDFRFIKNTWQDHYFRGGSIFFNAAGSDVEEVQKYINENKPLNLINKEGVGLIHAITTANFDRYKGLEEYILKNPKLLLLPVHTLKNDCSSMFYCEGVTPFHILAAEGKISILEKALKLVPEGAMVLNIKNETPLDYAIKKCKFEATKILLDLKLDFNKNSTNLNSALIDSVNNKCLATSILLLKAGASAHFKNKENKSAVDIAREKGNIELAFLLESL